VSYARQTGQKLATVSCTPPERFFEEFCSAYNQRKQAEVEVAQQKKVPRQEPQET